MNNQNNPDEEPQPIAGQLTYFNILANSIQRVNDAIMQDKDARDAAENLLSDIPDDWKKEVQDKIDSITSSYNNTVEYCNKFLGKGVRETVKAQHRREIYLAGKNYSRNIKQLVITLLKDKNLLYQTKKALEHGRISLYELTGEKESGDE